MEPRAVCRSGNSALTIWWSMYWYPMDLQIPRQSWGYLSILWLLADQLVLSVNSLVLGWIDMLTGYMMVIGRSGNCALIWWWSICWSPFDRVSTDFRTSKKYFQDYYRIFATQKKGSLRIFVGHLLPFTGCLLKIQFSNSGLFQGQFPDIEDKINRMAEQNEAGLQFLLWIWHEI